MQYTTHFNMTKAEGTDIVNPLTQIFPNFDIIDAAMYNNENAGIGTATEVTTGTVHAITRANTNNPVFRFTATSAWAFGDTMTVDGVSVSAHTSDGKSLIDGAYIIGAEVIGILNGTLVTVIISGVNDAGHVSVSADGVKTVSELLDDLFALANLGKVGQNTKLIYDIGSSVWVFPIATKGSASIAFVRSSIVSTDLYVDSFTCVSTGSSWNETVVHSNGTISYYDNSAAVPPLGYTIALYY